MASARSASGREPPSPRNRLLAGAETVSSRWLSCPPSTEAGRGRSKPAKSCQPNRHNMAALTPPRNRGITLKLASRARIWVRKSGPEPEDTDKAAAVNFVGRYGGAASEARSDSSAASPLVEQRR